MYGNKSIITVKEARKILGKKSADMSDEEILKLIDDLDYIAKHTLEKIRMERSRKDAP